MTQPATPGRLAPAPMPPMMRLVLRVALLYADARLERWCTASVNALAARASMSPRSVAAILRQAENKGFAWWHAGVVTVTLRRYDHDDNDQAARLRQLWARPARLVKRASERPMTHRDELLLCIRKPALVAQTREGEDEDAYDKRLGSTVSRFHWIRALADARAFARSPGRRSARSCVKAVAFAVDLLMDTNGRPFAWTTLAELGRWAGYRDGGVRGVRRALGGLERAGWIGIRREHGRQGGLLIWLRAPDEVRAQWAREDQARVDQWAREEQEAEAEAAEEVAAAQARAARVAEAEAEEVAERAAYWAAHWAAQARAAAP